MYVMNCVSLFVTVITYNMTKIEANCNTHVYRLRDRHALNNACQVINNDLQVSTRSTLSTITKFYCAFFYSVFISLPLPYSFFPFPLLCLYVSISLCVYGHCVYDSIVLYLFFLLLFCNFTCILLCFMLCSKILVSPLVKQ